MQYLIRFASVIALLSTAACDDSSSGMSGAADDFTCTVEIRPTEFDYVVRGNQLAVTWIDATTQTLNRVGSGSGVYGTWALSEDYNPTSKLGVKLSMRLETNRATAISECTGPGGARTSVSASSPATITASHVSITSFDSQTRRF